MGIRKKFTTPVLALLLAAAAHPAAGDSVCYAGYRDTSAAERATMTRILEAARRALPPAPAGWVVVNDDPPSVPHNLCMDFERKPWSYGYSRTFRRADADKQAEVETGTRAAADIMQADMAKKQPRLDALRAKSEVLIKQQVAFMQKGDMPKALALNEQMAVLQEETRKVMDEGDAQQRAEAIMKEAMRDIEIGISVRVNPTAESPAGDDSTAITVAGSPQAAYRWDSRDAGSYQGGALVLYGQWRTLSHGGRGLVVRSHVPANFAHGIAVSVHADEKRLASVIESIDFGALAGLVAP
jgi:hypothetical protein